LLCLYHYVSNHIGKGEEGEGITLMQHPTNKLTNIIIIKMYGLPLMQFFFSWDVVHSNKQKVYDPVWELQCWENFLKIDFGFPKSSTMVEWCFQKPKTRMTENT
jgi:hypothetical protein